MQLTAVGFNGEEQLGPPTKTGEEGWYAFGDPHLDVERDLYAKVLVPGTADSAPRLVGRSDLRYLYRQGPLRLDVVVCDEVLRGPSEFARLSVALSRAVFPEADTHPQAGIDHALRGLDARKTHWLAGHTGWALSQVEDRALASSLAVELRPPDGPMSAEPLYGLLRQGFPRTAGEMLLRPGPAVRAAIGAARSANVVGLGVHSADVLAALRGARTRALRDGGVGSLGAILSTSRLLGQPSGLVEPRVTAICRVVASLSGSDEELWAQIGALTAFSEVDRDEARRLVQLGTVALGHAPTVTAILGTLGTNGAAGVGGWSLDLWKQVASEVNPLPGGLEGHDEAERRGTLAALLQEHATQAFPAAAIHTSLVGPAGALLGVKAMLSRPGNATLDLRTARLHAGADISFDEDNKEAELRALRTAQRLVRIAPELGTAPALERLSKIGISSAQRVSRLGRARFIEAYAGSDPALREEAREIAAKAANQSAMAASFFLAAHPALGQANLRFIRTKDLAVTEADIPGWSELFTTPTGTRCSWCQSVHGPSAYLVELLSWVSGRTRPPASTSPFGTALDALLARRPDLARLPLSCENAERVLPYIDLTTEVLEAVVVGTGLSDARSSDVETPEMLAAQQYTLDAAYEAGALGDATRSFRTPFHRPLMEGRAFLAHLGIDRTEVMRAFASDGSTTNAQIAFEELGLSVEAAAAITNNVGEETTYWSHDLDATVTVRHLRRSAEVSYTEILDLLHTRLVNPEEDVGRLVVLLDVGGDPYDVSSYKLKRVVGGDGASNPSSGDYARFRKVLRLWRATGWSLITLDRVMAGLGASAPTEWDDETLTRVGELNRLARMTDCDPVELAAWFGYIDTFADREAAERSVASLYDRTWASPSLFPAAERESLGFPFDLNADAPPALSEHVHRVAAVLTVDTSEVTRLLTVLQGAGLLDQEEGAPSVTLANLSHLYRWASLARVLTIRPTEAFRLAQLLGVSPSNGDDGLFSEPGSAVAFIEEARRLLGADWSVDELDYVIRNGATERAAPADDFLRGVLGRLRDTIRAQKNSNEPKALLDALVRQLADEFQVERSLIDDLHSRMWAGAPSAFEAYPCFMAADVHLGLGAGVAETTGDLSVRLSAPVSTDAGILDTSTVITVPGASPLGAITATIPVHTPCAFKADGVHVLRATVQPGTAVTVPSGTLVTLPDLSTATLTEDASTTIEADGDVAIGPIESELKPNDGLLSRFLRITFHGGTSPAGNNPWSDLSRETFPEDFSVLEAIYKAVLLVGKVDANVDEQAAWHDRVDDWALLDPATLLGADLGLRLDDAFSRLQTTARLFSLRSRLRGTTPTFAALVADPTAANIASRTGWDEDLLIALVGAGVTSVLAFETMLDRTALVRRAGATVEVVSGWGAAGDLSSFTVEKARQVVSAARSRYALPAAWGAVARPVRDRVRKTQRDALVSYLIADDDELEDADDVYQRYLIDVSMNPEMLTSRIVQASATVQLFVHRSLFGLEAGDLGEFFNDEDRAEWEWMRTYRVWEAARKVFLYPENWIEPELRDDKTPFFLALERDLAQGDVTDDRVEQVSLDYLDRLLQVASLKILACYVEKESDDDGTIDKLHVFARTQGDPATYWYRRREASSTWTAWEEIKAGVDGEHLIPVVYNRRLMLFWAEFIDTQSEEENANPASWWEIRLAMSEHRDGKWSPKRVGSEPLASQMTHGRSKISKRAYSFVSQIGSDGLLQIRCVGTEWGWWSGQQSWFYDLGSFTLNTCTMDLTVLKAGAQTETTRVALAPSFWRAPGYVADASLIDQGAGDLDVYVGYTDESGQLVGAATPVGVLDQISQALVVVPSQFNDFVSQAPFFVNVGERAYFVEPNVSNNTKAAADPKAPPIRAIDANRGTTAAGQKRTASAGDSGAEHLRSPPATGWSANYRFWPFYHPFVCRFIREVRRDGIFGLVDPDPDGTAGALFRQALAGEPNDFEVRYEPTSRVTKPYPIEEIDFSLEGAYSQYNWEVFFHLPFYVANRLADAGRFQDAIDWFHAMFDPRTRTGAAASGFEGALSNVNWWKVKPFLEPASGPVTDWIAFTGADGDADAQTAFVAQVAAWREDPFNPHLLARLRPGTYQRALVMRYLETLIAWGDHLFTSDTLETINEATQLYVFAKQVLGDRPELLEDVDRLEPKTWDDLKYIDEFSNPLVALENAAFAAQGQGRSGEGSVVLGSVGLTPYFCVPFNSKLLSYWDTIDDRLFKVRNGMNIAGVVRSLPLFQPAIDPAMLVRAAAAGVDIGSVLSASTDTGNYRFSVVLGRAQALAGSVRALGQALLSALEKRDAEALASLRQSHEGALLDAVKGVRERQIEEAAEGLAGLRRSRKVVEARQGYYDRLISKGWLPGETGAVELNDAAMALEAVSGTLSTLGGIFALIPDIGAGFALHARIGGSNLSNLLSGIANALGTSSGVLRSQSGRLTTTAAYERRAQDWKHQRALAEKELASTDKQIAGAEIRVEIARRELRNHELQIRHSAEVRDWMERKFTNQELYDWMASQLATLHFQSWQLAHAAATRAEACYKRELGRGDTFVQAIHWDGTRKGLLAGERLQLDLDRMDAAYLDNDIREMELVKHVSIARLDPLALVRLREDGECFVDLPEVLFDLDCPGHYNRRLISVAVTVACVSGPHGQVNMRLTLHRFSVRTTANGGELDPVPDTSYPSIVTSSALEDGGLFSNDPGSPRYLPFERKGAISSWHLAFANQEYRQFDWSSVSDVVLHLRYTARDGGEVYRADRLSALDFSALVGGYTSTTVGSNASTRYVIGLSAKRDDPDAWYKAQDEEANSITLRLGPERLPYFATGRVVTVKCVHTVVTNLAPTTGEVSFDGGSALAISKFATWPGGSTRSRASMGTTPNAALDEPWPDVEWPDELLVSIALDSGSLADAGDLLVVLEVSVA
ncbi:MAG: neuraminidase-like domain-containing protein [Pseudomonadota bacterium]|nr:neuraminidase-like domain-containing protein [Pseudomonadota bacterium]